jgi:hypothetical protein
MRNQVADVRLTVMHLPPREAATTVTQEIDFEAHRSMERMLYLYTLPRSMVPCAHIASSDEAVRTAPWFAWA